MRKVILGALAVPYCEFKGKLEFLLLKHKGGFWTFPGGQKDKTDKTIEDCLTREIEEEIGLKVSSKQLIKTGLVNRFTYGSEKPNREGKKGETHFYLLKLKGDEKMSSWDKIIDHGWFGKDQIVELLPFEDEKRMFRKITAKHFLNKT